MNNREKWSVESGKCLKITVIDITEQWIIDGVFYIPDISGIIDCIDGVRYTFKN